MFLELLLAFVLLLKRHLVLEVVVVEAGEGGVDFVAQLTAVLTFDALRGGT